MVYPKRSAEGEARRLAALRSPEARAKMSAALKGKTPKNFHDMQQIGWAARRKEVLGYIRNWGRANRCEVCGKANLLGRSVHWANVDHHYSRDREDWKMMCRPCHAEHDQAHNGISFRKG